MSWAPMVKVAGESTFATNALRFATQAEAQASADELMGRWLLVIDTSAEERPDPVTDRWDTAANRAVAFD